MRLALWLEEEMRRRYGSREQAKRKIFARSASFKGRISVRSTVDERVQIIVNEALENGLAVRTPVGPRSNWQAG